LAVTGRPFQARAAALGPADRWPRPAPSRPPCHAPGGCCVRSNPRRWGAPNSPQTARRPTAKHRIPAGLRPGRAPQAARGPAALARFGPRFTAPAWVVLQLPWAHRLYPDRRPLPGPVKGVLARSLAARGLRPPSACGNPWPALAATSFGRYGDELREAAEL